MRIVSTNALAYFALKLAMKKFYGVGPLWQKVLLEA